MKHGASKSCAQRADMRGNEPLNSQRLARSMMSHFIASSCADALPLDAIAERRRLRHASIHGPAVFSTPFASRGT